MTDLTAAFARCDDRQRPSPMREPLIPIIAYHGTRTTALQSIRDNGILAHPFKHYHPERFYKGKRGDSVYVTENPAVAAHWAMSEVDDPSEATILQVVVPQDGLQPDEEASEAERYEGDIPPEWIKATYALLPDGGLGPAKPFHAKSPPLPDDPEHRYLVIHHPDTAAADAEFKENEHPRDMDGKFAEGSGGGGHRSEHFKGRDVDAAFEEAENPSSRYTIVKLSPSQFLDMAEPGHDEAKEKRVAAIWKEHGSFNQLPYLSIDEDGKVIGHEGRHRMKELRRHGVTEVPVVLRSDNVRWGRPEYHDKIPKEIISQGGLYERANNRMPMPDSVTFPRGVGEGRPEVGQARPEVGQSGLELGDAPRNAPEVQEETTIRPPAESDTAPTPKKTKTAYKLFRTLKTKPGQLFPLFIHNVQGVEVGDKWYAAGNYPTKGFAKRPGWHAGALPAAPHLRTNPDSDWPFGDGEPRKRAEDRVWVEVEIPDDEDWQSKADATVREVKPKKKGDPPTHAGGDLPDQIPHGGHYRWKPPGERLQMEDRSRAEWTISGAVKLKRILSNADVHKILTDAGFPRSAEAESHEWPKPEPRKKAKGAEDDREDEGAGAAGGRGLPDRGAGAGGQGRGGADQGPVRERRRNVGVASQERGRVGWSSPKFATDAEFKENEHPRDMDGKFTEGGGGGGGTTAGGARDPRKRYFKLLDKADVAFEKANRSISVTYGDDGTPSLTLLKLSDYTKVDPETLEPELKKQWDELSEAAAQFNTKKHLRPGSKIDAAHRQVMQIADPRGYYNLMKEEALHTFGDADLALTIEPADSHFSMEKLKLYDIEGKRIDIEYDDRGYRKDVDPPLSKPLLKLWHDLKEANADAASGNPLSLNHEKAMNVAKIVSDHAGYQIAKISLRDDERPFTLNGKEFMTAGLAYADGSGRIELFPSATSANSVAGVLSHEIMHQKFHTVMNALAAEKEVIRRAALGMEPGPGGTWRSRPEGDIIVLKPDGQVRLEYRDMFPVYTALHKVWDLTELAKTDGITDYSRDHWAAAENKTSNAELAANETLAEMAMLDWEGSLQRLVWYKDSKTWKPLYNGIKKLYPQLAKAEKPKKMVSIQSLIDSILPPAASSAPAPEKLPKAVFSTDIPDAVREEKTYKGLFERDALQPVINDATGDIEFHPKPGSNLKRFQSGREDQPHKYAYYDPRYAKLITLNEEEPIIARQIAVPINEDDEDIKPLDDPDVIYRGMSAEEYDSILKTGEVKSKGDYNIGEAQEGLTYWTTRTDTAQSYASSFAPVQFKPTPSRPAYIVATKRPKEVAPQVKGTGEHEVGVERAIKRNEITGIWRGDVIDYEPAAYSLPREGHGIIGSGPRMSLRWTKLPHAVAQDARPRWTIPSFACDTDFVEEQHPRDDEGKFTLGGGGSGGLPKAGHHAVALRDPVSKQVYHSALPGASVHALLAEELAGGKLGSKAWEMETGWVDHTGKFIDRENMKEQPTFDPVEAAKRVTKQVTAKRASAALTDTDRERRAASIPKPREPTKLSVFTPEVRAEVKKMQGSMAKFMVPTAAKTKAIASTIADHMGFDMKKLTIKDGLPPKSKLGPKYQTQGSSNSATGEITFYPMTMSMADLPGVTAHEIMHQKWAKIAEHLSAKDPRVMQALSPYVTGDNYVRLKEDDGATEYSTLYWTRRAEGKGSVILAIDETLAEASRLDFEGKLDDMTPRWQRFYAAVTKLYAELARSDA